MGNPELLEATASERLSLEEEYAMQKSWRQDADKLTFIICKPRDAGTGDKPVQGKLEDTPERMIGDVNLFISEDEDEPGQSIGEVEIMVAVSEERGKGIGKMAVLLFLAYVLENKHIIAPGGTELATLRVKIGGSNERSIGMFESLDFRKTTEETNYFDEWELRVAADDEYREKVEQLIGGWKAGEYTI